MEDNIVKLKEFLRHLKKNPKRTYTKKTILDKLEYIEGIRKEFRVSEEGQEESKEKIALKLEFNNIYRYITEYLEKNTKEQTETDIMAAFNLETVSKALPLFSGKHEELESFLITAELIHKTLSDIAKEDFLQYVYHAKLTSNVRTAIGSCEKPDNFDSLRTLLKQRYKDNRTIQEIQSRLSATFQGKLPINTYKERITNLIDNLNKLQINELDSNASQSEKNVIMKLNNKLALDIFKKGLNENLKTTIYAARPTNLQEATDLALELENEQKLTNNSVMYFNRHLNHRKFNNNSNNNRNNHRTNNNRNNNSYNRNNRFNNYNNKNHNRNQIDRRNNNSTNNNNYRRQIHTINNEGNVMGSEYTVIPDSQN